MHMTRKFCQSSVFLAALISAVASSAGGDEAPGVVTEKDLLAVLRSDAPAAEKAIACKQLAIHGSSESVPDLAQLLLDPQLASWARIPLEVIPGEEADAALEKATTSLEGKLLVGTINSIGVRRIVGSVDSLATHLQNTDAEVASAAAVALGRIGNASSAGLLRQSLAGAPVNVRSAIAEGLVLCAERFHSDGNATEAVAIYDEVRKSDVPDQRIVEATRGAILARNQDGIPLLLEQFQSDNKGLFQLGLSTAREFPGGEVDKALADAMVRATPERAALMVQAMADRKETVVLAAVLKAAEQGPIPVRLSAVGALARVGDVSCLSSLLKIAIEPDKDLAQAAKETLAALPGQDVDAQVVTLLPKATGKTLPLLIELVGKRRIEAVALLLKSLENSDSAVRSAALIALGETVALKDLSVLIAQVIAPRNAADLPVAKQALKAASIRMPDREACATELAAAVDRSKSVPTKGSLLEILGAMGGTKALATIGSAAKSKDAQLQDISSRLLGEWMTADAAPVLLDLAKTPGNQFQIRALRGYIRIARQFVLPDEQRVEMCQAAFDAARQTAEKKLVLDVLKRYPTEATLKLAIKAMQVAELKDDATQATLAIAQKLGAKGIDVREQLATAGFSKVKLEVVRAVYGAGETQRDVTAVVRKQAGDLPLITLASASYNDSFDGDPIPGSAKKLTIQYKINDKEAEASFAEDAIIILPMPK